MADKLKKVTKAHTRYYLSDGTLVPGATTVTGLLNKPALVKWANNLGLQGIDSSKYVDKAARVYNRLPEELKPTEKFNSVNELFFDKLNSSWRIATASDQVGRSRTLNFVHFSEVAFYECSLANLQKSIGEAMTEDAFRVYETTANGFNEAKDLWDSESCNNLFYEWWRTSEYRSTEYQYLETKDPWLLERIEVLKAKGLDKEQITWYCKKYDSYLDKNTIKQEYPITPTEAFVSSGDCVFDKEALNNQLARVSWNEESDTYHLYCENARGYLEYEGTLTEDELESRFGEELGLDLEQKAWEKDGGVATLDRSWIEYYADEIKPEEKYDDDYLAEAKEEYGTTDNVLLAGYINTDGSMLDFSGGYESRFIDHSEIDVIFDDESGADAMYAYMRMGNIRLMPEAPSLEFNNKAEPTSQQYDTIKQAIDIWERVLHSINIKHCDSKTTLSDRRYDCFCFFVFVGVGC